jgi:hypothetical protein
MSPLTRNTQIPTSLRGQIRAMVKAHAHWHAFLNEKGLISASAKNADLLEFALRHSALKARIEQTLQSYEAAKPKESAATIMLAKRVEKLLAAYAARKRKAQAEAALNDFNYVGSRHHY